MNGRVKKSLFHLLMIVLIWAVVEVAAVAGHAVLDARWFSPSALREQARGVAQRSRIAALDGARGPAEDRFAGRWHEVVHPYFGVVVDPDLHPPGAVSDLGIPRSIMLDELLRSTPETRVLAVFGGSFAIGVYSRLAEMRADRRLGGRRFVAVNFAKSGFKQPQQLMVLTYLLALGVRFDAVVNVDGFNEVALTTAESVARGVNPFYPRKWRLKARSVLDPEVMRGIGYMEYLEAERSRRAAWLLEHGLYRSPTLAFIWRALDRRLAAGVLDARREVERADARRTSFRLARGSWRCLTAAKVPRRIVSLLEPLQGQTFDRRQQLEEAVAARIGGRQTARHRQSIEHCTVKLANSYAGLGARHPIASEQELYQKLAGMWELSSFQMKALCEAYGILYFHFLQPNQYVPGSKPMNRIEKRVAINEAQKYQRGVVRGYPLLRESGRRLTERGVAFTDLTMFFEQELRMLYNDDCCHLNRRGYAMVADRILETIEAALITGNPGRSE